jgi:hypothetical protein
MEGEKARDNGLKYTLGLLICIGIRLIPRPPNVEPIMATAMPFSKGYGWLKGMLFSMSAIILYDLITHTQGTWSFVTAGTYGLLSIGAYYFLRNRENTIKNYVYYAIAATLFYDLITGVAMGHLIFKMPLAMVVVGQIPFTLLHLSSSILTAAASPYIFKWIVANPDLSLEKVLKRTLTLG